MSAFLLIGLVGVGVFVYIVGKNAPPPSTPDMASLSGLKLEDDSGGASDQAPDVSASDRSNNRRPWLNPTPPPAAPAPAATQNSPPPNPAPVKPAATVASAPPPPTAPPAATPPPTHASVPTSVVPPPAEAPPLPAPAQTASDQAMPSVLATEPAPGAPERFAESGALTESGRPRLAEPPLPPIEKASLEAPPPRFANIAPMKVAMPAKDAKADRGGKIAIVVQGLGLSEAATNAAIAILPPAVTLSFSPYAHDLRQWLQQAKEHGHEVLVEVPMESNSFPADDPGPLGLMTDLPPKEIADRFATILKTCPGAIGIDDISGSKFREAPAMGDVFAKLKQLNLIYVQGEPGAHGTPSVPNAVADIIVDERPFRAAIDARLDYAERLAKYQGSTVAVMTPKPVSFERLALWLTQIDKKNITLAPISQVLVQ
jgi:polysaccharide deacetylase 2 family uncharacterized protein YibQ